MPSPITEAPITQALRTAIQHSDEPMVVTDPHLPDHPMIAANDAFAAMTGYPHAEIIGRNCRFLQGAGTDQATARRIGRTIAEGHGCIEWIVNHRKDGSAFWNLLFLSPVRNRSGKLLHYFGNQLDITKGFPDWLGEVVFGRARMSPAHEAEFHAVLLDILEHKPDQADRARTLERVLASTRRVAELSTALEPGAADSPVRMAFLG